MSSQRADGEAALLAHDFDTAVLAFGSAMAIANDRERAEMQHLQQAAGEGKEAMRAVNENFRQAEFQLQVQKYMRESIMLNWSTCQFLVVIYSNALTFGMFWYSDKWLG